MRNHAIKLIFEKGLTGHPGPSYVTRGMTSVIQTRAESFETGQRLETAILLHNQDHIREVSHEVIRDHLT